MPLRLRSPCSCWLGPYLRRSGCHEDKVVLYLLQQTQGPRHSGHELQLCLTHSRERPVLLGQIISSDVGTFNFGQACVAVAAGAGAGRPVCPRMWDGIKFSLGGGV